MIIPCQERLMRFVNYDPKTGQFTGKASGGRRYSGRPLGTKRRRGYISLRIEGKDYPAHKLAWLYVYGVWPELLDHVNRNPSDNRIENLRECNTAQNCQNSRRPSNNESGYKGVSWDKHARKWEVRIRAFGKSEYLGLYKTPEEGAAVYDKAALRLHQEFAATNQALDFSEA